MLLAYVLVLDIIYTQYEPYPILFPVWNVNRDEYIEWRELYTVSYIVPMVMWNAHSLKLFTWYEL